MQGKEPFSRSPNSPSLSKTPAPKADKRDEIWGSVPSGSAERPKQVEPQRGLIPVSIESIEELDHSQQLLARMVKLAVTVSSERLKAERARVNIRHLTQDDSASSDASRWYDLAEQVEEIAAIGATTKQARALSKQLQESIDRFHKAQRGASEMAQEIVANLATSETELPAAARRYAMSRAIVEIRMALEQCALACEGESQDSLKRIEHRVQSILERLADQQGPSTKPTGDKEPRNDQEEEVESSATMEGRKLTETGGRDHLNQLNER